MSLLGFGFDFVGGRDRKGLNARMAFGFSGEAEMILAVTGQR
jgi:hypothetical protein